MMSGGFEELEQEMRLRLETWSKYVNPEINESKGSGIRSGQTGASRFMGKETLVDHSDDYIKENPNFAPYRNKITSGSEYNEQIGLKKLLCTKKLRTSFLEPIALYSLSFLLPFLLVQANKYERIY